MNQCLWLWIASWPRLSSLEVRGILIVAHIWEIFLFLCPIDLLKVCVCNSNTHLHQIKTFSINIFPISPIFGDWRRSNPMYVEQTSKQTVLMNVYLRTSVLDSLPNSFVSSFSKLFPSSKIKINVNTPYLFRLWAFFCSFWGYFWDSSKSLDSI